jgi:C4-dicarboxylate-specific signal transduction histidine kinase
VIFVTARTTKESKLEGLAVGAVDYITKPIDLDETVARVQTQLRFAAINRENLELQRRLEESRRAATIGAVAQGIAHNLNNLLGVVIGYLDLIKSGYDKPANVKKNAQNVDDAIQRIVGIIRQLSTLVVKSRPELTRAPLQRLLDGGIRRFHSDYKLEASVTVNNAVPDMEIDTNIETFEEVLSKLLINAWESYHEGPLDRRPVTIQTRVFDRPRGEKMLEVRVDDEGDGIAEDIRDRMFEPFVSTKRTVGVGMGLTIARHSLRSVGGEVTMAARTPRGASALMVHPVRDPRHRDKSQDTDD